MKKIFSLIILTLIISSIQILQAEELTLDILFTNDIHGGIDRYPATYMNPSFPPIIGGGGSSATYIKSVRKKADLTTRDNFLFDAGDFFQGHPIGTVTDGRAVIQYMNEIDYDLSVVGNHEYDVGEERLIESYKLAKFPILSCNIINKKTGKLVDYVTPYLIFEKLGMKIGVIGVTTTDTEKMSFPEHIKNIKFLSAKTSLEKYIKIVKEKGADIVIVVAHFGLPYAPEPAYQRRYVKNKNQSPIRYWGYDAQEIAHEVEGIDLIFGGHMHKGFKEPWEDPITHTLVMQGYAYGSSIGHVIIKIDSETKSICGWESPTIRDGILLTNFEDEFIPDEEIGLSIEEMQKEAEKGMDDVVGITSVYLSKAGKGAQSIVGNLVCDAMLEGTGADFSFLNLGGIRGEIPTGPITYRNVFDVLPFDSQIIIFEADGLLLKQIIEKRVENSSHGLRVAGIEVVYNNQRENFDKVTSLLIGDEPWQPNKIYKLATTDFLMQGNARLTMLTKIKEDKITRLEISLRDEVISYIRKNSPVSSKIDKRWKRDDSSQISPELSSSLMYESLKKK